jgi:hypothetical protein
MKKTMLFIPTAAEMDHWREHLRDLPVKTKQAFIQPAIQSRYIGYNGRTIVYGRVMPSARCQ